MPGMTYTLYAAPHPGQQGIRGSARMNAFFEMNFIGLLIAEICLSERPTEISAVLVGQVSILAVFLGFGLLSILMRKNDYPKDSLIALTLLFAGYFYTFGVLLSVWNGVNLSRTLEFPYRISCLFLILVIPYFVRNEDNLKRFFALVLVMMGLQIVRDLVVGADRSPGSLLLNRLWGHEYSSVMFMGTLPFAFGGLLLYWNAPRRRALKRFLLLSLCAVLFLKLFLTYSRMVWLGVVPLNLLGCYFLVYRKPGISREIHTMLRRVARTILLLTMAGIVSLSVLALSNSDVLKFIKGRQNLTGRETNARMAEYVNAAEEWLTSPLWGKGFGYETRFYKSGRMRDQDYVHNFVLQFLMSSGIVGLLLLFALLGSTFRRLCVLFRRTRSPSQIAVLVASLLTMFNIVLLSSGQTIILKQDTYFLLALVVSFAVVITRIQDRERNGFLFLAAMGPAIVGQTVKAGLSTESPGPCAERSAAGGRGAGLPGGQS